MGLFEWSNRYQLGIPNIDEQHREWFNRLTALETAIQRKEPSSVLKDTARFALDYTHHHFQDEESYMREIGYRGIEVHRLSHAAFKNQLNVIFNERIGGPDPEITLRVLARWASEHILTEDRAYASPNPPGMGNPRV